MGDSKQQNDQAGQNGGNTQGGQPAPAQTEKVHTEQTRETTTPPTPDAK